MVHFILKVKNNWAQKRLLVELFLKGLMTNRQQVEIKIDEMEEEKVLGCTLKKFSIWGEIKWLVTGYL